MLTHQSESRFNSVQQQNFKGRPEKNRKSLAILFLDVNGPAVKISARTVSFRSERVSFEKTHSGRPGGRGLRCVM